MSQSVREKASGSRVAGKPTRWSFGLSLALHTATVIGLLSVHHGLAPDRDIGSIQLVMVPGEPAQAPDAGSASPAAAVAQAEQPPPPPVPVPQQPVPAPQQLIPVPRQLVPTQPQLPLPQQQAILPAQPAVPDAGSEPVPAQAAPAPPVAQQHPPVLAQPPATSEQVPAIAQPPAVPEPKPTMAPVKSDRPRAPRPERTARSSAHPATSAPPSHPEAAARPPLATAPSNTSAPSAPSEAFSGPSQQQSKTGADPSWLAGVSAWLQAHRSYPEMARALGRQGTVVVRVTVDSAGRVVGFNLLRGSGSESLDRAAEALMRDAHLPPFPPDMRLPQQSLTVPIHYQLD